MSVKNRLLTLLCLFGWGIISAQAPVLESKKDPVSPEVLRKVQKILPRMQDYTNLLVDSTRLKGVIDAKTEELERASGKTNKQRTILQSLQLSQGEYEDVVAELAIFRFNVQVLVRHFDELEQDSKRLRTAQNSFEKGKMKEANDALNSAAMLRETNTLVAQRGQSNPSAATAKQLKNLSAEWQVKAGLSQVILGYPNSVDSAYFFLLQSLRCTPKPEYYFQFASFLYNHEQIDSALVWFGNTAARSLVTGDSVLWIASLMNQGALAYTLQDNRAAEKAYLTALAVYQRWKNAGQDEYAWDIAELQNNLGALYDQLNDLEKAERNYREALQTYRKLPGEKPRSYDENLAGMTFNLGVFYMQEKKDYRRAETLLKEALALRKLLAADDPGDYDDLLAAAYENLGVLYNYKENFEEAEYHFLEAKKIWDRLSRREPGAFDFRRAGMNAHLGELYGNVRDYEQSTRYYREGLKITRELFEEDSVQYGGNLATILGNFGAILCQQHQFDETERLYTECLHLHKTVPNSDPVDSLLGLASIYNNFGVLYYLKNDLPGTERSYLAAIDLYLQLAAMHPEIYEAEVAMAQSNLALLYSDMGRVADAIEMLKKSVALNEKQYKENPDVYKLELAYSLNNLGYAYAKNKQAKEAGECLTRSEQLKPDNSWVFRNWACYHILQSDLPKAIASLRKAADMGYDEPGWLETEPMLQPLRGLPEWAGIVEKVKKNAQH